MRMRNPATQAEMRSSFSDAWMGGYMFRAWQPGFDHLPASFLL